MTFTIVYGRIGKICLGIELQQSKTERKERI